ncbi:MAG: hypothetical protein U0517_01260 [Candidatus Andersenbacteria bacterium]
MSLETTEKKLQTWIVNFIVVFLVCVVAAGISGMLTMQGYIGVIPVYLCGAGIGVAVLAIVACGVLLEFVRLRTDRKDHTSSSN